MTLIRGMKSLFAGYHHDLSYVPDTDENLSACIVLESKTDNCHAAAANAWPDSILLNASIERIEISSNAMVTRTENTKFLDKTAIYISPKIDSKSNIQNPKSCCSKIIVNFENTGKYSFDKDSHAFTGNNFSDYRLNLPSKCLFEKEFLICLDHISEIANQAGFLQHNNAFTRCKFYPYGGLFEHGIAPKQIESCVFRTVHDGHSLSLRISPLSALQSAGIDINQISETNCKFIGNFSNSQKTNLHDELKGGACKIEVENKSAGEKAVYKSSAIAHTEKTNLIAINFVKEES